jgi:hypothetical protein
MLSISQLEFLSGRGNDNYIQDPRDAKDREWVASPFLYPSHSGELPVCRYKKIKKRENSEQPIEQPETDGVGRRTPFRDNHTTTLTHVVTPD